VDARDKCGHDGSLSPRKNAKASEITQTIDLQTQIRLMRIFVQTHHVTALNDIPQRPDLFEQIEMF
jgi:hypothetical protein